MNADKVGLGVDIIEIKRIQDAVKKHGGHFLNKVYTKNEIDYCTRRNKSGVPEFSVRFAAKEAFSKAMGVGVIGLSGNKGGVVLTDIEVVNDKLGKPMIFYKGKKMNNAQVSLSHCKEYAVAVVIIK